jgi:hypothetical protein
MRPNSVRITIDIPEPLHRKLKARAADGGCSLRELVLAGITRMLAQSQRRRPAERVQFPLIVSDGPKVSLTNEHIYGSAEFP